jgi:hypothetical protein
MSKFISAAEALLGRYLNTAASSSQADRARYHRFGQA